MFNFRKSFAVLMITCGIVLNCNADETHSRLQGNADKLVVDGKILEYHFQEIPKTGELRIPRLQARMQSVFWKGDPQSKLTLKPEPTTWVIPLSNPPAAERVVVLELLDQPEHWTEPTTIRASANMPVELPAHFASTHGDKLRYEPQPHKNTVGYWTNVKDWASWSVSLPGENVYHLDILQGCGTGQGGSDVNILLTRDGTAIDQLSFRVEETGHFQNFKRRRVGTLTVPVAGDYQLEIRPEKLAKNAVMDVRMIILTPQ